MTLRRNLGAAGLGLSLATLLVAAPRAARAGEAREHDGLYVRLGAGLAYGSDAVSTSNGPPGYEIKGTAKGFGGATELAVGYTVARGLVVGGGLYSLWFSPSASSAHVTVAGVSATASGATIDFDASSFHVLGPFVDYYLDPDEGLHLQGGLGLSWISLGDAHLHDANGAGVESQGGTGFGLMLGLGDEWWVSDGWSLGVSARLTMGFLSGQEDLPLNLSVDWSHTVLAPAILFTATMN
jgi:hypothetical protein